MQQETKPKQPSRLDPSKLLGFRNLVPVTPADAGIRQSSQQAFNKIGATGEGVEP